MFPGPEGVCDDLLQSNCAWDAKRTPAHRNAVQFIASLHPNRSIADWNFRVMALTTTPDWAASPSIASNFRISMLQRNVCKDSITQQQQRLAASPSRLERLTRLSHVHPFFDWLYTPSIISTGKRQINQSGVAIKFYCLCWKLLHRSVRFLSDQAMLRPPDHDWWSMLW